MQASILTEPFRKSFYSTMDEPNEQPRRRRRRNIKALADDDEVVMDYTERVEDVPPWEKESVFSAMDRQLASEVNSPDAN